MSRSWIFSISGRGWFSGAGAYPDRVGASKTSEMNATGPYLSNKKIQAKILSRKKMGAVPVRRHRPGILFFSSKAPIRGGAGSAVLVGILRFTV